MQILQESTCVGVFFNKVADGQNSNFIKKRLQQWFFLVKFTKVLRTTCFRDHVQWLLQVSSLQPYEKRNVFLWILLNFSEHLLVEQLWMIASSVYLWNLRSFSENLFYWAPMGNCLLQVQVAEYQTQDTVLLLKKLFRKWFSSILY